MKTEISYHHDLRIEPELFSHLMAEGTLIVVQFVHLNYKCYERRNRRRSKNFNQVSEIKAEEVLRHPSTGRRTRSFSHSTTLIDSTLSPFLTRMGVPYAEQRPIVDDTNMLFKKHGGLFIPFLLVVLQTVEVIEVGDPAPSRHYPSVPSLRRVHAIENKKVEALEKSVTTIMGRLKRVNDLSSDVLCAICLEEIVANSESRALPCSHMYHEECLLQWLLKSPDCPLCRSSLLPHS